MHTDATPTLPAHPLRAPYRALPRIGGTAVPGGVHFSTGSYGTASSWRLFLTGVAILGIGAVSLTVTYVILGLLGLSIGLPLTEALLGLAGPADLPHYALIQIGTNLLAFLAFLTVLHFSPLSGYHAAEHMVVHCLETFGVLDWKLARGCPRAHKRCGTTLLAGVLPIPLIAVPLLDTPWWPLAVLVVVGGWTVRYPVGAALQAVFTTREPNDRQLAAALTSAALLLARWRRNPRRSLPPAHTLWVRGYPQMFAGVLITAQVLNWINLYLPQWLDWAG